MTARDEAGTRYPALTPRIAGSPEWDAPVTQEPLSLSRWISGIVLRWRIVGVAMLAVVASTVVAILALPPVYRAHTAFVANTSSGSRAASLGNALSGGFAGVASQLGLASSGDASETPTFYDRLLESRELRTRLVDSRFPDPRTAAPSDSVTLLSLLRVRAPDERRRREKAIEKLRDNLSVATDLKTNMVLLTVSAEWPEIAAAVANRATALVQEFNLEQRQSRSRAKRVFIEGRLQSARSALRQAEADLRSFYEGNRQFQSSPELRLREGELRRQVDLANDLFMTLQRERESSLAGEIADAALITVVDTAIPPAHKAWPRPVLALATASLVGLMFGIIIAGLVTVLADWADRDRKGASRLRLAMSEAGSGLRRVFSKSGTGA